MVTDLKDPLVQIRSEGLVSFSSEIEIRYNVYWRRGSSLGLTARYRRPGARVPVGDC